MKLLLYLVFLFLGITTCFADWPVKRGRLQLIPTYSVYNSSSYFNNNGNITSPTTNGDHFRSSYFGFYTMYGISDRLDLLVNMPFINQNSVYSGKEFKKTGFGDMSIGLAYHIPSRNLKNFLTFKGAYIFPAYQNIATPYLGYASRAIQLATAYSFNPNEKTFVGTEANFTRYFDQETGPSQFSFSGTFGYYINKWDKLTFNFAHLVSISSDNSFSGNLAVNKDFTQGKITLGYSRRITRTLTPMVQFYFIPYGYNTGAGTGLNLSLIIKIP